jgi:predicted esterase
MKYFINGLGQKVKLNGFKVLDVSIDDIWNLPRIPDDSVLVGFSIGAIIAYLIALRQPLKQLILCSPSPIIEKYKIPKCKISIIVGSNEESYMIKNANLLAKRLDAKFYKIPARHRLTKKYIGCIKRVASS